MSRFLRVGRVGGVVVGAAALSLGLLGTVGSAQARPSVATLTTARFATDATHHDRAVTGKTAAANVDGCNPGFFCVAPFPQNAGFAPSWYIFPNTVLTGTSYFYPWGSCSPPEVGCDVGIHSFANNTGHRVWLESLKGGGQEGCISNGASDDNYNGANDNDFWIYVSENPNPCP